MSEKQKRYVRAKRICEHPNLLFEQWLQEWESQAKETGSNMQYVFRKALRSLQKFPLPLRSGNECKVLGNFGEKICKRIDTKMQKYIQENGPIEWDNFIKVTEVKPRKKDQKNDVPPNQQKTKRKKTKSPGVPKLYVPAHRSGGFALMIALKNASSSTSYEGHMKKKQLIEAAQPFCDASFEHPPDGSRYTAWSSMSTLIKKGLVDKEGCPAKYFLTETGAMLAADMVEADSSNPSSSQTSSMNSPKKLLSVVSEKSPLSTSQTYSTKSSNRIVHDISDSDSDITELPDPVITKKSSFVVEEKSPPMRNLSPYRPPLAESTPNITNGLPFTYVDTFGREVPTKEKASVNIDETYCSLGFLIKCKKADLLKCSWKYKLNTDRKAAPGLTFAYLDDDHAPEYSTGLTNGVRATRQSPIKLFHESPQKEKAPPVEPVASYTFSSKVPCIDIDDASVPPTKKPRLNRQIGNSSNQCSMRATSRYTLRPGQFKVVLCVDNAEVVGGISGGNKKTTKEIITSELSKIGIDFEVRKLHIGDFLWIVKEITTTGQSRELVLPYVAERKRMDDLASSIKDGRFREQKFRLKQSGVANPIYLVENYGSKHAGLPLATLQQAISNTQFVNDFHIKYVLDQKESAAYLAVMTTYLSKKCQSKSVHYKEEDLSCNLNDRELNLCDFEQMNARSMKNKQLCVRDMFIKHLLQLNGLSVDKAAAIADKYPTPTHLLQAFSKCQDETEKQKLISSLKGPVSGKAVGPAVSSNVVRLYSWNDLS